MRSEGPRNGVDGVAKTDGMNTLGLIDGVVGVVNRYVKLLHRDTGTLDGRGVTIN